MSFHKKHVCEWQTKKDYAYPLKYSFKERESEQ